MRCLVTGASGYVGGRLVPRLLAAGYEVRCLTRSAKRLRDEPWFGQVEVAEGDVNSGSGLNEALDGVEVAYYLIHSLGLPDFERLDRESAHHFASAAAKAGVRRIVYLGGPEPTGPSVHKGQNDRGDNDHNGQSKHTGRSEHASISPHLRSRAEVARILLDSGVPTTVLRAAVIIGSGSASFEMLRHLVERLPVMVTPRWVSNHIEPIAIRDVLRYLVASAAPETFGAKVNRGFDIGGGEVLTYAEMMRRYAVAADLGPRVIVPVRPLTPGLSSLWVGLVTPVPNSIARPLVESLIHEATTGENDIAEYVPDPPEGLTDFDTSLRLALRRVRATDVRTETLPSDALGSDPSWSGATVYTDVRTRVVHAPPERLWRVVEAIGGETGWYSFPLAWAARGWLDRLAGGVGLRRGRRDPHRLHIGEALDFWRVEEIVPGSILRLRAEMRLPGRAWLEIRVVEEGSGRSRYEQRAIFVPHGLAGRAYWAAIAPFHTAVFGGMARNIARAAEGAEPITCDP